MNRQEYETELAKRRAHLEKTEKDLIAAEGRRDRAWRHLDNLKGVWQKTCNHIPVEVEDMDYWGYTWFWTECKECKKELSDRDILSGPEEEE